MLHRSMRKLVRPVMLIGMCAAIALPQAARAQWVPNGVALCDSCYPDNAEAVSDGAGGAVAAWNDGRRPNAYYTAYAQRVSAIGSMFPNWPHVGLAVIGSSTDGYIMGYAPDGTGGVFLGMGAQEAVRIQHLLPDGSIALGWPATGVPIIAGDHLQLTASLSLDGAGGVIVFYTDAPRNTSNYRVYAQHLTASGSLSPGWPATGMPVCPYPESQSLPSSTPAPDGGAYAAWGDGRNRNTSDIDLVVQRIAPDGSISPGWPANGMLLCTAPRDQKTSRMVGDGAGGAYVAWSDFRTAPPLVFYGSDIYLGHVTPDGALSPGWPVNGLAVCTAAETQQLTDLITDGEGGVFLAWEDSRPGASGVYVQHVRFDGSTAPGWPTGGRSAAALPQDYLLEPRLCADGSGGVYVAYTAEDNQYNSFAYIQHLAANSQAAPGWPASGALASSPMGYGEHTRLCADGHGGAIMVWSGARDGRYSVYAQRYAADGPVAVRVSLVSAQASADAVSLLWQEGGGALVNIGVERRTEAGGWEVLGAPTAHKGDQLAFEDRSVVAGTRYAYRLTWDESGARSAGPEGWVDVPVADRLTLVGLRPNPGVAGDLRVAFSLASASPATLELIDVTGRRVASRAVGGLGAGAHVEPLAQDHFVTPGLYWLRLTQSGEAVATKAVVAR